MILEAWPQIPSCKDNAADTYSLVMCTWYGFLHSPPWRTLLLFFLINGQAVVGGCSDPHSAASEE